MKSKTPAKPTKQTLKVTVPLTKPVKVSALLEVPPKSDFPGTGPQGNGIAPTIKSQGEWIRQVVNTDGCTGCPA